MSSQSWHSLEVEEALRRLNTDEKRGLTSDEAAHRLEKFGPNVLQEEKRRRVLQLVVDQFKDAFVIMLLIAAVLSYVVGQTRGEGVEEGLLPAQYFSSVENFRQHEET